MIFHEQNKQNSATARYNNITFESCSDFEQSKRNILDYDLKKNKNLYRSRSDIDLPGDEAWNAHQLKAEELFQRIRQKEIET